MKSSTTLAALIAHCRKLTRRQPTPDAELLQRYIAQREAAAFEELLERYAPLVWSVCRRMLSNEADCEDAFQAAFLVLVRRASSIAPDRPLGAWLHTVAVHVADKARTRALRQPRQTIAAEPATCGDVAEELGNRELFRLIDEEIARLPALLREPFVLCCLEGRTRDEAAAILGCSVAAIKSRLERSRNLLRRRLERRGFGLPAAFLVLGLTGGHVRAALRTKAVHCVLGSVPATVAALVPAAGVSLASKLALTAVSFVIAGALGFGALHGMQAEPSQEAPAQVRDIAPKTSPSPAAEKSQPRLDRFGDPLPPGAVRRFGTLRFRHAADYSNLMFTPDSKLLIAGEGASPLSVFDAITGRNLRAVGKTSFINPAGFALSPDGKSVACCGSDVFLWDLETGRLIREFGCGRCQAICFSPDGKKIAAVPRWRAEVILVEVATGKRLAEWTVKKGLVNDFNLGQYDLRALAFSPDGKFLAGILSEWGEVKPLFVHYRSSQICLLDAEKGTRVRTIGSADDPIQAFAFQPGSGRLAGVSKSGIFRLWDPATGKEMHQFLPPKVERPSVNDFRFSADGRRCLVQHNGGLLAVLDTKDSRELRRIEIGKNRSPDFIAFSPDGRTIASAKRGEACVRVWDAESGVERLANAGHHAAARLSISDDGRTLISRDENGETFHWDVRTGTGQRKPSVVGEKAVRSPRAGWNEGRGTRWQYKLNEKAELEIRELNGSHLLRKMKMPTAPSAFAFSSDGLYLAIALQDARHTILLWEPEKEESPRRSFAGHPTICQNLLFSHDGKQLIATTGGNSDRSSQGVWIWDVAKARLVHKLATNSLPSRLLLTADDRLLFAGGVFNEATVYVWDMETGKEIARLTEPSLKNASGENDSRHLEIAGLALSADERFLAVISNCGEASSLSIWETGSWKLIRTFTSARPRNYSESLIFTRDGRSLFVANADSTILEWDVSGRFGKKTDTPDRDRLNALWQSLIETPDKAYPAVWEMLDHPAESVPFLIAKVSPVETVKEERVRQLLAQLDSESFTEREDANRQLLALGEQIVPLLQLALKDQPSLEMKKRIERAIEALDRGPSQEQLRLLRALAVLEWSRRPEAVEHLRRLSGGAQSARLTLAAKAAWQRLKR